MCIAVCLYATVRGALTDLPLARRAILEMVGVIVLTPFLDILAGTVVEPHLQHFVRYPALLAIIAPLVSDLGAIGGILSSRLSSKLHLGVISPARSARGGGVAGRVARGRLRPGRVHGGRDPRLPVQPGRAGQRPGPA